MTKGIIYNKDNEHLNVLKAIKEIPFCVGKKLLIDHLRGNKENLSIIRNKLFRLNTFGSLGLYQAHEIEEMIGSLRRNEIISYAAMNKSYGKVIVLGKNGEDELKSPTFSVDKNNNIDKDNTEGCNRSTGYMIDNIITSATEEDMENFRHLGDYLKGYNDMQKKSIISNKSSILCIAGAGTGKTTVLTKRIDFLSRFRSVRPRKILAITFTRKARDEMQERLSSSQHTKGVNVHTFNSFCERQLRHLSDIVYGKKVKMIGFRERINLVSQGLRKAGTGFDEFIISYFTRQKSAGLTKDKLISMIVNDCFSILDLIKIDDIDLSKIDLNYGSLTSKERKNADIIFTVCRHIQSEMSRLGLRDYSDQLIDCWDFFRKNPEYIPKYEHVLVDEYQDVNLIQKDLIDILKPKNIFAVGDPRQSIYGWRGSRIRYIMNFKGDYPKSEIISLKRNYRSSKNIVKLINSSIRCMKLPELKSDKEENDNIRMIGFDSTEYEYLFISKKLKKIREERKDKDIFVLSRKNNELRDISSYFSSQGIEHMLLSEENGKNSNIDRLKDNSPNIVLGTVHAVKGMQADIVFVFSCTPSNFPCRASEHPIMELISANHFDKFEEERRLFYVALSRAKEELYITYSGSSRTSFINPEMVSLIDRKEN